MSMLRALLGARDPAPTAVLLVALVVLIALTLLAVLLVGLAEAGRLPVAEGIELGPFRWDEPLWTVVRAVAAG